MHTFNELSEHLRPRLFFLLICLLPYFAQAQVGEPPLFPQDFIGNWAGDLAIYGPKGIKQTVPMELLIHPLNDTTYTYTIIYGEDKVAGKRVHEGEDIPKVESFLVAGHQRAILRKAKK